MEQVGVDELTWGTRCAKDLVGRDNSGFTVKGLRFRMMNINNKMELNRVYTSTTLTPIFQNFNNYSLVHSLPDLHISRNNFKNRQTNKWQWTKLYPTNPLQI